MAVGRAVLPREQVSFAFTDVPAGMLGSGDTAVEVGFSLDAWNPPLIQPAVQAVFFNPTTGERKSLQFTPEPHHPTLLYLDREFWHGGPLGVQLESLTDENYLGFTAQSLRLRVAGGPFLLHFGAMTLSVWLFGTVLAAAGVMFSTRLSWYVSILGTATFFLVSSLHDYILHMPTMASAALRLAQTGDSLVHWSGWYSIARHAIPPVPDLPSLLPGEAATFGQVMSLGDVAGTFGWAMLSVVTLVILGSLALRKREVAA
jgi:hypothetical protein